MYRRKPYGWIKHLDFMVLDIFSLLVSFPLACFTRFGMGAWPNYNDIWVVYLLTVLLLHIVNNTFSDALKRGYYREFVHTLSHTAMVELAVFAYLFATQQGHEVSRIVIGLVAIFYMLVSYMIRILWKYVLRKRGSAFDPASLYLITTESLAEATVNSLSSKTNGEYKIQGICLLDRDATGEEIAGIPVPANAESILDYICDKWVDEVYIALPEQSPIPNALINTLTEMGIAVHVELDQAGSESWQIRQAQYIGEKLVQTISMTNVSTRTVLAKRIMDIMGGIVGCLITLILTVIIGPLIYIQSPGPIFFVQTRVGKNGKQFRMYKFRSMYLDAEERKKELLKQNQMQDDLMFKLDADPRIIGCKIKPDGTVKKGIGNFIRSYSLDEFPQFFNVLKGEMSLVGTRPPTVDEWKKYNYHHRVRLSTKPGITGLWQVSGRSNITNFEEVVELDKKYIREWDIGLDLRILLKTFLVVFRKDGAM